MPGKHRAHTPIVTRQQQKLFGYWDSHPSERPRSITSEEVESHLEESKGKKLPQKRGGWKRSGGSVIK